MDEKFEKPPTNRAQAWFRLLLWILPSAFASGSGWLLGLLDFWVSHRKVELSHPTETWWIANALLVFGAAALDTWLAISGTRRGAYGWRVGLFCLCQVVLIPLVYTLTVFWMCFGGPLNWL